MSYSDADPAKSYKGVVAFLYILIVGVPVALYSVANMLLGRCDSDGCMPWLYYLIFMFPGPLLLFVAGLILIFRWASR